jgi:class 3 adenylate cyclase/CheY-like chemotaxis protein
MMNASIAIIDDEPLMINLTVQQLKTDFDEVTGFLSGRDFLEYYTQHPAPDAVLVDFSMPDKNGVEIYKEALQDLRYSRTIFLCMSGYAEIDDQPWLSYLGFDAVLQKPFIYRELKKSLREMLEARDTLLQNRNIYKNFFNACEELAKLRLHSLQLENHYIKRLISPEVYRVLDSNPKKLIPKIVNVAVGFVDIRGFTSLLNRTDIDIVNTTLSIFFQHINRCIRENKGLLSQYTGDGAMWLHTNRTLAAGTRACIKTAQAMIEGMEEVNEIIQERLHLKINLGIGIGIACGKAAVGIFGDPHYRIQYTALGSPVNLASRLCAEARPNEILIGGEAIDYCQSPMTKLGFRTIKGFDHEVEVQIVQKKKEKTAQPSSEQNSVPQRVPRRVKRLDGR